MFEDSYWSRLNQRSLSRRRLLLVAGAGIGAVELAGCSSRGSGSATTGSAGATGTAAAAGAPQSGGNYNTYLASNPTLDPHKVQGVTNTGISGVMSRPFRFRTASDPSISANHEVEPDLAVSAESPDAITWTIKLRPDAKFQNIPPVNGHPVEAEDIKATFARALDPSIPNPNRGGLNMIDLAQVQTPDKQTVVFKLNYPFSPFHNLLAAGYYAWIYPREALAGSYDPGKVVIGSGPFLLDTNTPDVAFTYKKNPDYFDKAHVYLDTWKYAIIPDASQQLAQFAAGNLDELLVIDPYQVPQVQGQNPKATVLKAANASPNPLYFQMGDSTSVFQDIRVRRAFSMAIDRDAISKAIYNGQSEQVVYLPSYMGKWSLKVQDLPAELQQNYKYNPADAKKLLEAAGQANVEIKLAYPNTFGTPVFTKQAETIANMLNAAGIKATIVIQDYIKDFIGPKGSRNGNFDKDTVMYVSAAPFTDPDEWLFSYFHSKSTANQEHLKDPTYDAMVDKERTIVNEDDRLKAVQEIQKYLAQQMYAPSTVGSYQWAFVQPRMQNYQYTSNTIGRATETFSKLWVKQ